MTKDNHLRVQLSKESLAEVDNDNLFTLLEDLQEASNNLFMEAWRRGIHKDLAEKGMQMKYEGPKI